NPPRQSPAKARAEPSVGRGSARLESGCSRSPAPISFVGATTKIPLVAAFPPPPAERLPRQGRENRAPIDEDRFLPGTASKNQCTRRAVPESSPGLNRKLSFDALFLMAGQSGSL